MRTPKMGILPYSQTHDYLWRTLHNPKPDDVKITHANGISTLTYLDPKLKKEDVIFTNLVTLLNYLAKNKLRTIKTNC